jgi:SAM-dependent methyltransferase
VSESRSDDVRTIPDVATGDLPSDISGTNSATNSGTKSSDAPSTTREPPTSVEIELELTLDRLDSATNYADWVGDRLAPYVSGDVLELGAGSGTLTERLRGRSNSLVAVEPYPVLSAELAARFVDDRTVEVITGELDSVDANREFDAAVLVNVLEHIEDDTATLSDLYTRLRPHGTVVLFVPAFQMLYSDFDRRIGHHRRYRKRQLIDKVRAAGFDIQEARYFNMVGFPLWLVGMRALRLNPGRSALTTIFDRYVVPALRRIESVLSPPVGQSLICVGTKPVRK